MKPLSIFFLNVSGVSALMSTLFLHNVPIGGGRGGAGGGLNKSAGAAKQLFEVHRLRPSAASPHSNLERYCLLMRL